MGNISYRIRNCFTLPNITACSIGVGVTMIGLFAPVAFPNISQGFALVLTYVGVGVVVFGLILAAWKYIKNPIEKRLKIFGVITVLDRIYKHLEQFAEEDNNAQIDLKEFSEISDKITTLAGADVPIVSSVDEAKNAVSSFEMELPNIFSRMFPKNVKRAQKIKWIHSVSRLLDKDGYGLKQKRKRDRRYGRLLRQIDEYFEEYKHVIDDELRVLIRSYIDYAESAANALLFVSHMDTMLTAFKGIVPNILTPSLEANIEGFSEDIREIARDIRVEISQYIRGMDYHDEK